MTQLLSARARTTGQESMSGTSVIRDILWLVQLSEDAFRAVIGVVLHQNVSGGKCEEDLAIALEFV